jgi:hypothetical protein
MTFRTFGALLVVAGLAAAQQQSIEDKIRQQAAEVSRLMRESERLLLEMTRVDRLVATQKQVEEELKKLLPPEQGGQAQGGADAQQQAKRQELEAKHQEISQQLEEMLKSEKEQGALAVERIQDLLKMLPRDQQQTSGSPGDSKDQQEREKQLRDQDEKERKQHQPRSEKDQQPQPRNQEQRSDQMPKPPEGGAASRLQRAEAWVAHLPPEEQERINRNDLSRVPLRYRKLIEEYTAHRAKREADEKDSSSDH